MSHERTALIDGVRLTRAQLEAGLKQLEEPEWCEVIAHCGNDLCFATKDRHYVVPLMRRTRGDFARQAVLLHTEGIFEYQIIPDPHHPNYMLLVCRPKQEAK